jgi:beta-glucosidase
MLVGPRGPAILEAWFPGQEDGDIVADLLFGRANPSGRLPVTIPFVGKGFLDHTTASQFPGVQGAEGKLQTVTYTEQLAIGYRWYDANASGSCARMQGKNPCVAFPFGHGLSYTNFATGKPRLAYDAASKSWRATLHVSNSGMRAGAEVVQVYLSLPAAANALGLRQPPKRLVGFGKIELAPGASGEVSVTIDPSASNHSLGVWNSATRQWSIPAGLFKVWVGRSSDARDLALAGTFRR